METLSFIMQPKYSFDHEMNCIISGDFYYTKSDLIPLYDSNGNFVMNHSIEERTKKKDKARITEIYHTYKYVFQKDYKFYLVDLLYHSERSSLERYRWGDVGCFFDYKHIQSRDSLENYKFAKPIEMCLFGTQSFSVFHNLNKRILDFDYKEYLKNKNDFIKENDLNESQMDQLNYIFDSNLLLYANYFLVDIEKLKSKSFDIKKQTIERLMFKINQKQNKWK
jgi:hypothetical protein